MRKILTTLISASLLLATRPSQGALIPRPGSGDPRIYVVDYDPAQVVELRATMGYQTFVEFASDEHIENVAVGDAAGWQITPNRAANLLFVKPMSEVPTTNMTVAVKESPRRPGDPPTLISDPSRIKAQLGWKPAHEDLDGIIASAFAWEKRINT